MSSIGMGSDGAHLVWKEVQRSSTGMEGGPKVLNWN